MPLGKKQKLKKGALVPKGNTTWKEKALKRISNLYDKICSVENLQLADMKARRGKRKQRCIQYHDVNKEANISALHEMLSNRKYRTSEYKTFKIYEPKERLIFRLPYYPDRIVHHAVMNVLEPVFVSMFTADTYSCIKGRGIMGAARGVWAALKDRDHTTYCLQIDIKKFYPNIDHAILKQLLRKKIKDESLLWLLDEIIDSAEGLPIGNYLSQYLANFYLTYFDHWLKEQKGVKYYFRYADDIVIVHEDKQYLQNLLSDIKEYLGVELKLTVKGNYQVFPVAARGIDFVGYVFYHTHILLRKSIKKNFARMLKNRNNPLSIASYKGWTNHCNSFNLLKKLLVKQFSEIKIERPETNAASEKIFAGEKIDINKVLDRKISVHDFEIRPSKYYSSGECLFLQISIGDTRRLVFTSAKKLIEDVRAMKKDDFPFMTTIIELENKSFKFS